MKTSPLITFLLPTRGRSQKLKYVLDSLSATCSTIGNYEVVLVFDDDDVAHIEQFQSWDKPYHYKTIVRKRAGYNHLEQYYNDACSVSSGEWLWLWNDDSTMISRDWDLIVQEYSKQFVILNPWNTREVDKEYVKTHVMFPIIPRVFYETLGHLSAWNHVDAYIQDMIVDMGLIRNEFRIVHTHDKEIDETSRGVQYCQVPYPHHQLVLDKQKISDYLNNTGGK